MAEEKLLTIRDVSQILGISEKEVIDLAEDGKIPAYKVGGVYLRFKKEQIEEFRKILKPKPHHQAASQSLQIKSGINDKISDFFYFNDFYILSTLVIVSILFIIFRG